VATKTALVLDTVPENSVHHLASPRKADATSPDQWKQHNTKQSTQSNTSRTNRSKAKRSEEQ
jgi:hypothetical protein